MSAVIKAGIALAVLVEIFSVVLILAGLHESAPMVAGIVFILVAIVLNVGCVFWGLKQTADNGYGKQLLNGLLIGLVAGVLIFAFSMLNLSVLFPDYLDQSKTATIEWLESMNIPQPQLEAQVAQIEGQSAMRQAVSGLIGTVITSLIVGAIISIFVRKK